MKRIFLLVLDSFGIGYTNDSNKFGDYGANTLGHISQYCANNIHNLNHYGYLNLPNFTKLGLSELVYHSSGYYPKGLERNTKIIGSYAYSGEISSGKDTLSGHWEIAGVPVLFDWDYFTNKKNSIPTSFLNKIINITKITGFLGNCHESGTVILDNLGEEHIRTNKPIVYTSTDSVFQIACHEKFFGLDRLNKLCKITRDLLNKNNYNIARVISRPFIGKKAGEFQRTGNRRDFSVPPYEKTVLQKLIEEKNGNVVSIGKISDIFAGTGISKKVKAVGLSDLFDATIKEIKSSSDYAIVFTNFVDFDSIYGHRRNSFGYANALEYFDKRLPELIKIVNYDDLLIITADHGCDPTWYGSNHTREYIPIFIYSKSITPKFKGVRFTFSDISQTISKYFKLTPMSYGVSII